MARVVSWVMRLFAAKGRWNVNCAGLRVCVAVWTGSNTYRGDLTRFS
jgi:hypothetical protein